MRFFELQRGDVVIDLIEDSAGYTWVVLNVTSKGGFKVEIEWLNLKSGEVLVSTSLSDDENALGEGFSVLRGAKEMHL